MNFPKFFFRNVQEPNFVTTNKVNTECRLLISTKLKLRKFYKLNLKQNTEYGYIGDYGYYGGNGYILQRKNKPLEILTRCNIQVVVVVLVGGMSAILLNLPFQQCQRVYWIFIKTMLVPHAPCSSVCYMFVIHSWKVKVYTGERTPRDIIYSICTSYYCLTLQKFKNNDNKFYFHFPNFLIQRTHI